MSRDSLPQSCHLVFPRCAVRKRDNRQQTNNISLIYDLLTVFLRNRTKGPEIQIEDKDARFKKISTPDKGHWLQRQGNFNLCRFDKVHSDFYTFYWILATSLCLSSESYLEHQKMHSPSDSLSHPESPFTQCNTMKCNTKNTLQQKTKLHYVWYQCVRNITICVKSQWPILRIASKRWKQPKNDAMNKHTRLSLNSLSTLVFECIKHSAAVPILVQISVFPFKGGQGGM